jgi:hypothetical protein
MPLNLYQPIEQNDPYLERICALQEARNRIAATRPIPDLGQGAYGFALLVIIDELIEQLRERSAR